jgi:hypothetical protein
LLIGYGAAYLLVERVYPSFMAPVTALAPLGGDQGSAARLGAKQPGRREPLRHDLRRIRSPRQPRPAVAVPVRKQLAQGPAQPVPGAAAPPHDPPPLPARQQDPDFHLILIGGYLGLGAIAAAILWWLVRRTSLSAG